MKRLFIIIIVFTVSGCYHLKERSAQVVETPPVSLPALDSTVIANIRLIIPTSVHQFYKITNYNLVWHDSSGLLPAGDSLIKIINKADHYGLIPTDYHLDEINTLLHAEPTNHGTLKEDVLLTDCFFALRHHLRFGRVDEVTLVRKDLQQIMDTTGVIFLSGSITDSNLVANLQLQEPINIQYKALKDSLQKLLAAGYTDSTSLAHARQISLTLERLRFAGTLPDRYIRVNVPSFLMQVIEDNEVKLESNVIVGKPETSTPSINSIVKSFVIYPYWHVPRKIAIREILPAIQHDSTYLLRNNFEVLDRQGNVLPDSTIDWTTVTADNFQYVLRQREGRENSLGIIKFVFSNKFGVYLHDTNSRRLFKRDKRAMSHGCVRVHKAVELAHYLVNEDSVYVTPEDLDQYLSLQQRLEVKVRNPIPVSIFYHTSEFRNGVIHFYEDIYRKDSLLYEALHRKDSMAQVVPSSAMAGL